MATVAGVLLIGRTNDMPIVDCPRPEGALSCRSMAPPDRRVGADPKIESVLGPLGASIMRIVWSQGEGTVRTIADQLELDTGRNHAYTTVMTILARLSERGLLDRTKVGRGFVYRPRGDESEVLASMGELAVDRLLEQYGTAALRRFAHHLSDLEPDLRARLLDLADRSR
ncbi:MAG: BlaI/MecI/CopY family transcriptional regulator [Candidatus Limnocylindria bacterium]